MQKYEKTTKMHLQMNNKESIIDKTYLLLSIFRRNAPKMLCPQSQMYVSVGSVQNSISLIMIYILQCLPNGKFVTRKKWLCSFS